MDKVAKHIYSIASMWCYTYPLSVMNIPLPLPSEEFHQLVVEVGLHTCVPDYYKQDMLFRPMQTWRWGGT